MEQLPRLAAQWRRGRRTVPANGRREKRIRGPKCCVPRASGLSDGRVPAPRRPKPLSGEKGQGKGLFPHLRGPDCPSPALRGDLAVRQGPARLSRRAWGGSRRAAALCPGPLEPRRALPLWLRGCGPRSPPSRAVRSRPSRHPGPSHNPFCLDTIPFLRAGRRDARFQPEP